MKNIWKKMYRAARLWIEANEISPEIKPYSIDESIGRIMWRYEVPNSSEYLCVFAWNNFGGGLINISNSRVFCEAIRN